MRLEVERESVVANQAAAPTVEPIKCDSKGNIYFRFYRPTQFFSAPVLKLTPEGERKASFSAEHVSGWQAADILDFDVGGDGQVYLLTSRLGKARKIEHAIITLDPEGRHRFTIEIKTPLKSASRIGVFSTGEFLVTGHREPPKSASPKSDERTLQDHEREVQPVVAILNRNGNIISEVDVMGAVVSNDPDSESNSGTIPIGAIDGGANVAGDDGNLYVLFRTQRPTIRVINARGELVKMLAIRPPSESAEALDIGIAHGVGLLVQFGEKGQGRNYPGEKMIFSIIDPETGNRLYDYQSNVRLGGAFGCYDRGKFSFLGNAKGQFAILTAQVR